MPDHIKPLAHGGTDTDNNIRCLCAEHHRIRTAEQFGHRIKQAIGEDGWPNMTVAKLMRWKPKSPCDAIARLIIIAALIANEHGGGSRKA